MVGHNESIIDTRHFVWGEFSVSVTAEELLARVDALLPAIAARAAQSEADRKPHKDSVAELIDAGIYQTLVPKKFGGHEFGLDTLGQIVRKISSADMSTGWVSAFYIGHNWMLTKFPLEVQSEVFAERPFGLIPIQPSPGVKFKEVPGGYEVSGRSKYSSGIMHGDWVIIANASPAGRAFVVPVEEVEIIDTWHMSGMAATGSNDVVVKELFVPSHRTMPTAELFNGTDSIHSNPIYAIPLLPFIYCEVLGVYCGGLEGATAAYETIISQKVASWGGDIFSQKQAVHINLGEAYAATKSACILFERIIADTAVLAAGEGFSLDTRLALKLRAGFIANLCRDGMNAIMAKAGTSSFSKDEPLQRFFRDINTLATHAFLDWDTSRELYGRHRFGLEPNHPLF